jgi:broad specificity phosphatase PhoE
MTLDLTSGRRLVLVRHGQTAWNAVGRGQGHHDVELDELGHEQSAAAAGFLATFAPVSLWSSDLARCRQTTAYVAKETGLDSVYDARLREYDLGARTGLTMEEFASRYPEEYAAHRDGRFEAVPEGESTAQVEARMRSALADVLAGLGAGETALVVSHGAALKVAIVTMLGWPAELASGLAVLSNGSCTVLEETSAGGRLRLTAYNLAVPAG